MGYFVQISDDAGAPLFQAVKNYPDVSFASSALFHALVTASLERGFVPSILRAQDATIGLAVHGDPGSRLSIAVVSSEFPTGQTRDIEAQLHWRMQAIYRGALIAAGRDALMKQPADFLRKAFSQRLAPMVARLMADESLPGVVGSVPLLGMATCGAASEWLPGTPSADAAFERLVASLPAGGGVVLAGLSPFAMESTIAVLSWQGRAVAATPAWRCLESIDRGLLLALADDVGPPTFGKPTRTLELEIANPLWLPSAAVPPRAEPAASPAATSACSPVESPTANPFARPHIGVGSLPLESEELLPVGVPLHFATTVSPTVSRAPKCYKMISMRIYPELKAPVSNREDSISPMETTPVAKLFRRPVSVEDAFSVWDEDASLVFSVVEAEGATDSSTSRPPVTPSDLQQCVDMCGQNLQNVWDGLPTKSTGAPLLRSSTADIIAAVLLDEVTQDIVVAPPSWHISCAVPWQCERRRVKTQSNRRLLYWMHSLPPLTEKHPQQYVCCEDYSIGARRREDGIQCWALIHLHSETVQNTLSSTTIGATTFEGDAQDPARTAETRLPPPVHTVLEELMSQIPVSVDLRMGFSKLIQPPAPA